MYHRRFRKPSKPAIFVMLMLASGVLALLPRDFLAPLRHMTQLAAIGQYGVSGAAKSITQSAKGLRAEPVPAARHAETEAARKAAENENVALRCELERLREINHQLEQVRNRPQFPSEGRLIPAQVVGWDALPGRDSITLLKGRRPEVKQGDWVASRLAVQAGSHDGASDDLRVLSIEALAGQTLIGWVEQASTYASRVVLLSDRYTHRKWYVHIVSMGRPGRENAYVMENGRPTDFALEGIGDGKMRILDVNARFINDGLIRVGDFVTTDGRDPKLPLTMVIGEIVKLDKLSKHPLLYHAIVEHRCNVKDLSQVFIVNIPR
jgi:cell shape-determining protein MreC